jgi:hypothetical protein
MALSLSFVQKWNESINGCQLFPTLPKWDDPKLFKMPQSLQHPRFPTLLKYQFRFQPQFETIHFCIANSHSTSISISLSIHAFQDYQRCFNFNFNVNSKIATVVKVLLRFKFRRLRSGLTSSSRWSSLTEYAPILLAFSRVEIENKRVFGIRKSMTMDEVQRVWVLGWNKC